MTKPKGKTAAGAGKRATKKTAKKKATHKTPDSKKPAEKKSAAEVPRESAIGDGAAGFAERGVDSKVSGHEVLSALVEMMADAARQLAMQHGPEFDLESVLSTGQKITVSFALTEQSIRTINRAPEATDAEAVTAGKVVKPEKQKAREVAVQTQTLRWVLARHCKAAQLEKPTPPIVGRAMQELEAIDPKSHKTPDQILSRIDNHDRQKFSRKSSAAAGTGSAEGPECRYVHITEETADGLAGRPPKRLEKKWSAHIDKKLTRPQLEMLRNSGLAKIDSEMSGKKTKYLRYLTPLGQMVFKHWPEWDDPTGGVGLADEELSTQDPAEPAETDTTAAAKPPPPGALPFQAPPA